MSKKILYESEEAAVYKEVTLKGWWARSTQKAGKEVFWGDNEHMARWDGCTHISCGCGEHTPKSRTRCQACAAIETRRRYEQLPVVEWDGETPLCTYDNDLFFFDEESVLDHCAAEGCSAGDLMLVLCDPVYLRGVDEDHFCDCLPEDIDLPCDVADALNELNEAIKNEPPVGWYPSKKRVEV